MCCGSHCGCAALATYRAAADAIVLPVGPKGGVTYDPEVGLLGAGPSAELKGGLFLDVYLELLGVVAAR
ncbi:hypothetical protein [Plantactinospora sp. DSM 117369]